MAPSARHHTGSAYTPSSAPSTATTEYGVDKHGRTYKLGQPKHHHAPAAGHHSIGRTQSGRSTTSTNTDLTARNLRKLAKAQDEGASTGRFDASTIKPKMSASLAPTAQGPEQNFSRPHSAASFAPASRPGHGPGAVDMSLSAHRPPTAAGSHLTTGRELTPAQWDHERQYPAVDPSALSSQGGSTRTATTARRDDDTCNPYKCSRMNGNCGHRKYKTTEVQLWRNDKLVETATAHTPTEVFRVAGAMAGVDPNTLPAPSKNSPYRTGNWGYLPEEERPRPVLPARAEFDHDVHTLYGSDDDKSSQRSAATVRGPKSDDRSHKSRSVASSKASGRRPTITGTGSSNAGSHSHLSVARPANSSQYGSVRPARAFHQPTSAYSDAKPPATAPSAPPSHAASSHAASADPYDPRNGPFPPLPPYKALPPIPYGAGHTEGGRFGSL